MTRVPLGLCAALCAVLTTGLPGSVWAQGEGPGSDETQYQLMIDDAIAHYAAGRFAQALAGFEWAHAVRPSARTLRGIGLSAFYLGDRARARQAIEAALVETNKPLSEAQRSELQALLEVAVQETGRFSLELTPASARVTVDGVTTHEGVLTLPRGEHVLAIDAPGYARQRSVLRVRGGEDHPLRISLEPAAPSAGVASARPASPAPALPTEPAELPLAREPSAPEVAPSGSSTPVVAWIAVAAVPVLAGGAAAVWFTGLDKRDAIAARCEREGCTDAQVARRSADAHLAEHETWATISLVGAGVALVTASVAFALHAGESDGSGPVWTTDGTSATLRAQF